jgi:hypothetical protein
VAIKFTSWEAYSKSLDLLRCCCGCGEKFEKNDVYASVVHNKGENGILDPEYEKGIAFVKLHHMVNLNDKLPSLKEQMVDLYHKDRKALKELYKFAHDSLDCRI